MKINHFIPTLVIGASSLLGSCTSKPNAIKTLDNFAADSKLQTILTDTFSTKISKAMFYKLAKLLLVDISEINAVAVMALKVQN